MDQDGQVHHVLFKSDPTASHIHNPKFPLCPAAAATRSLIGIPGQAASNLPRNLSCANPKIGVLCYPLLVLDRSASDHCRKSHCVCVFNGMWSSESTNLKLQYSPTPRRSQGWVCPSMLPLEPTPASFEGSQHQHPDYLQFGDRSRTRCEAAKDVPTFIPTCAFFLLLSAFCNEGKQYFAGLT